MAALSMDLQYLTNCLQWSLFSFFPILNHSSYKYKDTFQFYSWYTLLHSNNLVSNISNLDG